MADYALDVNYGEEEAAVRVPLPDCDADHAETERQALVQRIEHAVDINAPEIFAQDTSPGNEIAIDPHRVSSVDLVDLAELDS